ncbi:MAG: alanine dehydrogenase [Planctomycetota bacterium]|jgi:alanine dehydrogenase
MKIGVPKEVKSDEYRVGLRPVGAELMASDGHHVIVQRGAGLGSGIPDEAYVGAGAELVDTAEEIYGQGDMIVKVKEPQPQEIALLRSGQVLFTYFHFAASRELTLGCLNAGVAAVAYETLRDVKGRLPLLTPMSEVAGRMSIQEGAKYLERPMMGRGILLGGVPGVEPANVLVLGGGVVGASAALVAAGMGANVVIMDVNLDRLRELDAVMPANVTTVYSDPHAVDHYARNADLLIGSVLIPGARAPHLLSEKQVKAMRTGAVVVDVCIDQGGCVETSRPTTHHEPTYIEHGVVHYCVTNMPGAVGRTSTHALCNATLPYGRQLAGLGVDGFIDQSDGHAEALNMRDGKITYGPVADVFKDLPCV